MAPVRQAFKRAKNNNGKDEMRPASSERIESYSVRVHAVVFIVGPLQVIVIMICYGGRLGLQFLIEPSSGIAHHWS